MSNSAAREFLYVVQESALNTPLTTPSIGTTSLFIRLVDGNSFSMVATPVQEEIPYGGGLAKISEIVSDHYSCTGTLKTKLYGSQAAFLMGWSTTEINAGQTLPWTTSELPNDLASCSVYHGIQTSTGVFLKKAFSGCKVGSAQIEVSRQSTTAMLTLQLTACAQTAYGTLTGDPTTALPTPTEAEMPLGPYTFSMLSGGLSVASASRTMFSSFSANIQNTLDGQWFESPSLLLLNYHGRKSKVNADLYLKLSPDDRSAYESGAATQLSVVFTNGVSGQNMTLDFKSQNKIVELPFDLPIGSAFQQKLGVSGVLDQSAGTDLAVSFA